MKLIPFQIALLWVYYNVKNNPFSLALLTIGGAIGSILSSLLLKSFSRKNCLLLTDLFSIMSIFILYLDESVIALLMSRFLVGVTLGLNAVIVKFYIL